jgi:hypothetical protein
VRRSSAIRKLVVLETHRMIRAAVEEALEKLRAGLRPGSISYPPGAEIPARDIEAFAAARVDKDAVDVLRALLTDACASSMFQLFTLLDGVADPEVREVGEWLGVDLTAIKDDKHREMLHDMFMDTWSEFNDSAAKG